MEDAIEQGGRSGIPRAVEGQQRREEGENEGEGDLESVSLAGPAKSITIAPDLAATRSSRP